MSVEQNALPNVLFQEGVQLLQKGDIETAAGRFLQVLQSDPSNGKAQGYLGVCLVQQGRIEAGIASLNQAALLQPYDAAAQYNLAAALMQAQQTAAARTCLERALAIDPNYTKARAALENLGGPVVQETPPPEPPSPPQSPYYFDPAVQTPVGVISGETPALQPLYAPASAMPPYAAAPPPPYGMDYNTQAAPTQRPTFVPPPIGTRILRGIGWGALYGQCFTGWIALKIVLSLGSGGTGNGSATDALVAAAIVLISAFIFVFIGGALGFLIAAVDATIGVGAMMGVGAGAIVLLLQIALGFSRGAALIFGIVVAWSLGRYVGAHITARIRQPIQR